MTIPARPKIYHITHVRNLPQLATDGWLWSDAKRLELGLDCKVVGMSTIKCRRLEELDVKCHPGTKVGQYAPFYFCARSIMLYILSQGNHPDLEYTGGQRPIVHLEADLEATVEWADANGKKWAFTDRNAGAYVADFFNSWDDLDQVNWAAVAATDFRSFVIKEGKQAEFLLYEAFPWTLVERIGVLNRSAAAKVEAALTDAAHKPPIEIKQSWYY